MNFGAGSSIQETTIITKIIAMLKRRNGYMLLTLLVLTGLAGRLHTETLNGKERRLLIQDLKSSRQELRASLRGLTEKQLDFRPGSKQPTIREAVYQLSCFETALWNTAIQALKNEEEENRKKEMEDAVVKNQIHDLLSLKLQKKFDSYDEALSHYYDTRADILKFARTTTGNVRAHSAKTSIGVLDVYQLMLLNSAATQFYVSKIREIKAHPKFPAR